MNDKIEIIPKSVLAKVEILRRVRNGEIQIFKSGRQTGWTWAQDILDAQDVELIEQKLLTNPNKK